MYRQIIARDDRGCALQYACRHCINEVQQLGIRDEHDVNLDLIDDFAGDW